MWNCQCKETKKFCPLIKLIVIKLCQMLLLLLLLILTFTLKVHNFLIL